MFDNEDFSTNPRTFNENPNNVASMMNEHLSEQIKAYINSILTNSEIDIAYLQPASGITFFGSTGTGKYIVTISGATTYKFNYAIFF